MIPESQWETAFLAQELLATTSPLFSSVPLDPILTERPASPILTTDQARDALAQTAGLLLHTVNESEQRSFSSETDTSSRADKFAKSTFMDLMRKLRDGEVAVEGDKVVEQTGEARMLDKGKGKENVALNPGWANEFGREEEGRVGGKMNIDSIQGVSMGRGSDMDMGRVMNGRMGMGMNSVGGSSLEAFQRTQMERKEMSAQWARDAEGYEDMKDVWMEEDATRSRREGNTFGAAGTAQFQGDGGLREEEDVIMNGDTNVLGAGPGWEEDFGAETIVGGHSKDQAKERGPVSAQEREWDLLQNDWDTFEATATGIKNIQSDSQTTSSTIAGYAFATSNPYYAQTRTHSLHSLPPTQSTYESVLEKEAAVLQNPTDSHAWFELGIKQQENEREEQAILALTRALQLDPDLREAYLALAVSYTNENERSMAYDAIDRWIDCLAVREYTREIDNYRDLFGKMNDDLGISEKHDYLTGMLIRLAQSRAEKNGVDVDADVQIGLGVLFNTSEEYDKAGDCFGSALSVRPDVSYCSTLELGLIFAIGSPAIQSIRSNSSKWRKS